MQTTLDSEGKVMIPQSIRDALGLGPGTRVTFSVNSQGEVVVKKRRPVIVSSAHAAKPMWRGVPMN